MKSILTMQSSKPQPGLLKECLHVRVTKIFKLFLENALLVPQLQTGRCCCFQPEDCSDGYDLFHAITMNETYAHTSLHNGQASYINMKVFVFAEPEPIQSFLKPNLSYDQKC